MNRHVTLHRHARLRATLAAFCALLILAATTPCAMAVDLPAGKDAVHDCPHCPPQPCHDVSSNPDCDGLNPVDKPRGDCGVESMTAATAPVPGTALLPPARMRAEPAGPPPARDGPRRHLLLATFNE